MKAPTIFTREALAPREPARRHLQAVPEHVPSAGRRPPWRMSIIALITVVGMLVSGAAVYAWQHAQVVDREATVTRALGAQAAAMSRASALGGRITDLQAKVVEVQKQLTGARGRAGVLRQRVADLHEQLQSAAAASTAAQGQLLAVAGPAIADGRYLAFIKAVGATQAPPLVVIDVAQWFEGDAADRAARKDGILPPGKHMPNGYYIRNASPTWRTLQVGSDPRVSLITWHQGALGWSKVTLGRLAQVFTTPNTRHASTSASPFWVRIEGGLVTGIHQQYIP